MRPTTLTNTVLITGRTNDKQTIFDKNYIKLFCREVQETNEHSKKECLGLKSHLSIPSEINLTGVLSTTENKQKHYITMKSLILAQDER